MSKILVLSSVVIKELYRRKDFYVLFVVTALITILMGALNFFHEEKIARYLKDICLLLIWISSVVIAVTTAARQIPAERESRTIFPLLAKPVSRAQFIAGKFVGCWLACGIALLVFYTFFAAISASREGAIHPLEYFQAGWLHWGMLGIVVAMVLLGSVIFTPSANITLSFVLVVGILILGGHLNKIATAQPFLIGVILSLLYFLMPHFEWFYSVRERLIFDQDLVPWGDVLLATLYAAVFIGLLLFTTWLVFRRKVLTS